jgi:GPH family glycoside/pentoside/hexuronide:cation symporter
MPGSTLWRNARYGSAAFVLGLPTIPLLVLLPPFYAETMGLGLTATGIALFAARTLDVFSDPVVGYVSDRQNSRRGGRKPLIAAGALLGAISTYYLLTPENSVGVWYLGLWAGILYLGWTLINIPYLAWGASLSNDYQGRAQLTSVREVFTLLGILTAAAVPAIAASYGYSEQISLGFIAWGTIGIGLILFPVLLFSVPEPRKPRTARLTAKTVLASIKQNKPFGLLIVGWFLNSLANGIPAVLFILFMKHVLAASDVERGILTTIYFLAGIIGIPIWLALSARVGKHRSWCFAMILACCAFALVPILDNGDIVAFACICALTGVTLGADMALPPAIQADVAEYEYFRSGYEATGTLFAIWSMITKLSFGLSVLIAFPMLDALGFDPQLSPQDNNLVALAMIYAVVPIVLKAGAIILLWHYPLTAQKQAVIRQHIEKRTRRNNE